MLSWPVEKRLSLRRKEHLAQKPRAAIVAWLLLLYYVRRRML
jgi:hypothetical protein